MFKRNQIRAFIVLTVDVGGKPLHKIILFIKIHRNISLMITFLPPRVKGKKVPVNQAVLRNILDMIALYGTGTYYYHPN